jgi:hypothetical protein
MTQEQRERIYKLIGELGQAAIDAGLKHSINFVFCAGTEGEGMAVGVGFLPADHQAPKVHHSKRKRGW